jgi:hypothetical protein
LHRDEKERRMTTVEWYYARDNKQLGPVSAAELKRLSAGGELLPDDLVWREGMSEWSAARNVRGLFEEGVSASLKIEEPGLSTMAALPTAPKRHPVDALLERYRPLFTERLIDTTAKIFRACGSYGLFVAIVLTATFAIIAAAKTTVVDNLLWGAIAVLALAVLQYVAGKFCDAVEQLNKTTASSLSSAAFPDCFAMLSKLMGAVALLGSVAAAVETSQYSMILFGIPAFLIWAYLALVALNPAALNIAIVPELPAGEEALGVLMFLAKAILRVVPVAFGAGVICGTLALGYACWLALSGREPWIPSAVAHSTLLSSAALPLAAYLMFLFFCLLLDLCRAILGLPANRQ